MEADMVIEKEHEEMVSDEKFNWDCKMERKLFYAMRGLKPVGLNRHFMMVCIHKKFTTVLRRNISSKVIWDHLDSLYDMAALHESEILPFSDDEVDYDLPPNYYDLAKELLNVSLSDVDEDSQDSKSESSYNPAKKSNTAKSKQNGTPVSSSKTTFATPISGKSTKQSLKKSETRPTTSETKLKQESPLPAKLNKSKRSSSPFTTRNSKSDQSSAKEDTPEPPAAKKLKTDTSTPLPSKKTPKPDSNSASKKSGKQELNVTAKSNKSETPSSSKKLRNEKESSIKKSKASTVADNTLGKKNTKTDSRRSDQDSSRRISDIPSTKNKSDRASSVSSRGSKHEDSDSSVLSGSRKSSPAVRGDSIDKKKKKGSPVKRRRT